MNFIQKYVNDIKSKWSKPKELSSSTLKTYKIELEKFMEDIKLLGDQEVVDQLINELGISGTAREYQNLNTYFKSYYYNMIKELDDAEGVPTNLGRIARISKKEWEATLKGVINYLYRRKTSLLYGNESLEKDHFSPDIKIYHANSFSDQVLPWLRKEEINEGLAGAGIGAISGVALAFVIGSVSKAFKVPPKSIIGVSAALGAIIGQYIQKHFFIDLTNYVKLKRLVEYEPESYETIIELLQKNATKFKEKDPVKYKKIINNLSRLQNNAPPVYRNYLDDEIEKEAAEEDDADVFDVRDPYTNKVIKYSTSELTAGMNRRSRSSRYSYSYPSDYYDDYTVDDLGSFDDIDQQINDLVRKTGG